MSHAVIAGYARTPFHFARKGKLTSVRPDDLAAIALRGLVARLGIEPALIEDVVMGCAYPKGEQGTNVQERFALASQQKAAAALGTGRLSAELIAVPTPDGLVEVDGCLRPQTILEGLAQLKPAFGGTVTAGTASPLTDGAAAVLVCSEEFARVHGLAVLARIRAMAVAGVAPDIMGMGPVPATRKALARAGLTIDDIEVVELNEAFASQAVACMRDLGIPPERTNIDGGAIALGHPLGATGARIIGKAAQIVKREGKRFALATQCIGGGQGIATVLEAA
jgi:acetyl-CoA acyltransferase